MNPHVQQTIDTLSSRVARARASMAKLAADGTSDQRIASMQEAAGVAAAALLEVSKSGSGPEVMAVIDKATEAVKAFEEAVAGLVITPADEQLGRFVTTPQGTVHLNHNMLLECRRHGVKPEAYALQLIRRGAPRVA